MMKRKWITIKQIPVVNMTKRKATMMIMTLMMMILTNKFHTLPKVMTLPQMILIIL